ncbi:hypothetical protein CMI48_04120 [Candidatus Pacearchaeota archaeon]|nr:hypothetical protein [Candidatus Pacearchaeota archaeon]
MRWGYFFLAIFLSDFQIISKRMSSAFIGVILTSFSHTKKPKRHQCQLLVNHDSILLSLFRF